MGDLQKLRGREREESFETEDEAELQVDSQKTYLKKLPLLCRYVYIRIVVGNLYSCMKHAI